MPVHYDSVFTPGVRAADAISRPRPRNDRPGCIVLRVERYELKPVLDAQGRPMLAPQKDAEGRCVLAPDGQRLLVPQQEAVGVYGTASCSGEKIYMRLSTDEELKALAPILSNLETYDPQAGGGSAEYEQASVEEAEDLPF